ncbi:MAG: DUF4097 family beta strand repeat-containing protein [Cytophagales bacterium]
MKKIIASCFLCLFFAVVVAQQKDKAYKIDKEYNLSPKGKLTLKCSDAKVSIKGTNRKNAYVKIYRAVTSKGLWVSNRDEFHIDVQELNGDLTIEERQRNSSTVVFGYVNETHTIQIELPETASVEIKGDDGDFLIQNVDGGIAVKVDDADVDVVACSGSDFHFDMKDGNLTMDEGAGKLEVDASDGKVRIANGKFAQMNARISDGNLEVATSLANEGQYRINAGDGSVSFTVLQGGGSFEVRHGDRRVTAEGRFKRVEETDDRSRFELASGTAKVNVRADDARIRLIQVQ